jgi:signal transduction histidine kinase
MGIVLVLDDRADDRELLATLLRHAGHEVVEADTGAVALELARLLRPEVVVVDLLMPLMSGYEFAKRLRADPALAHVEVIFWTASYLEEDVRAVAAGLGVERFIAKPSPPEVVIASVSEAIRAAQLRAPGPPPASPEERNRLLAITEQQAALIEELERQSARRQRLLGLVLVAQEDARERLAAGIHDDPLQAITAVGLQLAQLDGQLADPALAAMLARLRNSVGQAVSRLRGLLFELDAAELQGQTLVASLSSYLEQARDDEGLAFVLIDRLAVEPPAPLRRLLSRLARELLMNVRKHARASRVEVILRSDGDSYVVRVSDDGVGFEPDRALSPRPGHLGLAALRERVELAGGAVRISSAAGEGSTVEVELPSPAVDALATGEPVAVDP